MQGIFLPNHKNITRILRKKAGAFKNIDFSLHITAQAGGCLSLTFFFLDTQNICYIREGPAIVCV